MKKILNKNNIKYYLIFYIIVELISRFTLIRGIINYIYAFLYMSIKSPNFETFIKVIVVLIIMLILWMLSFIIMTLPVTIFLLARKTADISQEIQNRKYTSRENVIYFREKLNNISPTTMSLVQNLKIEEEKDLTATIMKLQLNKNISIENDNIKLLSNDVTELTSNERRLFYILTSEKINKKQIEGWKEVALEEAKNQGYIEDKNPTKGLVIKKIILFLVFIVFILGLKYFKTSVTTFVDELEHMGITEEMQIDEIAGTEEFDFLINGLLQSFACIICIIGMLGWPIFYTVYIIRHQNKNNSLKRTPKGEQLTDEILGMKRFIHDFSMMDSADKESIVLWDDFLVYAIVLEENKKIIDEILTLKNIKNYDSRLIIKE